MTGEKIRIRSGIKLTSLWSFSKDLHLSLVRLAGEVTLKAILVSALLLAHLTVPSQLLQTL